MKAVPTSIFVLAVTGCASSGPVQSSGDAQLDVYAAVFQVLMEHNASAEMLNKKGIVLCLPEQTDPDALFLRRFSANSPPVYPCSASHNVGRANESVLASSGEPVIIFSVAMPTTLTETQATVTGSYYEASLSAAVYSFTLERRKGVWVVVSRHMSAIS